MEVSAKDNANIDGLIFDFCKRLFEKRKKAIAEVTTMPTVFNTPPEKRKELLLDPYDDWLVREHCKATNKTVPVNRTNALFDAASEISTPSWQRREREHDSEGLYYGADYVSPFDNMPGYRYSGPSSSNDDEDTEELLLAEERLKK